MRLLRKIYSFSQKEGEKQFSLNVYLSDSSASPIIINIKKNGKESSIRLSSRTELVNFMKSYGDTIFQDFSQKVDLDDILGEMEKRVSDSVMYDTTNIMPSVSVAPEIGDIVVDNYTGKLGRVVLVEYIGEYHFPIYHVLWEDGTRSVRVAVQMRVALSREELEKEKTDWNRIREMIDERGKLFDPYGDVK